MSKEIMINVENAAKLAQFTLTPQEKSRLEQELPRMMEGIRLALHAVNVANVEPMVYGGNAGGGWRPDTPGAMLDREEALRQAPERLGEEFKVPRIVE